MTTIGKLPRSVFVNGREYAVRTDFRDILTILRAFHDPDLKQADMVLVCLVVFYPDFTAIPQEDYEAAYRAAVSFMDHGIEPGKDARRNPRIMDWEQDAPVLFPAINHVAGRETRNAPYLHWWTFMGYYMEVSEGIFATITRLRTKRARGEKLEKWEREFWTANRGLCELKTRESAEIQAEKDRLNALIGR